MTSTPRPTLFRLSRVDRAHDRALQRRHRAGELHRLCPGVYLFRDDWDQLGEVERHLTRARAIAPRLRVTSTFSHLTAALILGWPLRGSAPERVHVLDRAVSDVEHRAGLVRHVDRGDPAARSTHFEGIPVTTALETAVALATTLPVTTAAIAVDGGVRRQMLTVEEFVAALPLGRARGSVRSRTVATALDPRHESPGESYTAIRLVELGAPQIVPQQEFRAPSGHVDRVDFWIPSLGVVVEFDGRQKYVDPEMLGGRDPADVLWQEKLRQDRLTAHHEVRTVVRVTWWHLVELDRLRALFREHGVVFA